MRLSQKIMVLYHKLFAQVVVSKRRGREFSIDELFAINITGRSTNKRKPYSRQTAEELLWLINNHLMPLKPANILVGNNETLPDSN